MYNMSDVLIKVITDTLQIALLVTVMMIAVDIINNWSRGKIAVLLQGKRKFRCVNNFV